MAFPTDGVLLSDYSEVLKRFYLPAIQEQLNNANPLSAFIENGPNEDVSGKEFTINCHYGRSSGTGARADGGVLPNAGAQAHKTMTVPMKYIYGRVAFSGPTIAATRDAKGAYANVIDNEIQGITQDLTREVNRMHWGCGYGVLGRWRSTASGTSYTIQKKYRANSAGGDGFGSTFGGKYMTDYANAPATPVVLTVASSKISVATVDTTDMAVSAVSKGTFATGYDTITCTDPSVTEAAGTFYVRPGNAATLTAATSSAGDFRLEPMGLRGIVTDTDLDDIALFNGTQTGMADLNDPLQSLAVATYPWWKSIVLTADGTRYNSQQDLTLPMMQEIFDEVEIAAGKDYGPDFIMTPHAIRREYLELMKADNRTVNTMDLDGGFTALSYNGVPLMVDRDAIDGEMYFLTLKDIKKYSMADYNWMDRDGAILTRISNYDAYEAVLYRYYELGCVRRNSQGVLCDLNYTSSM